MSINETTLNNQIKETVNAIENANAATIIENAGEELIELSDFQKAKLERYSNDTKLKENLSTFIKWFTAVWSIGILTLIYLIAFNVCWLSDKVIIILATETLLTTLGLPGIVIAHFFPNKKID